MKSRESGIQGKILEIKWGEKCIWARNGYFIIAGSISSFCLLMSFPQYQALHILSQFLQGMHGYLYIQKENILPVRVAKLSLKTHTGLFAFILSAIKKDNIEHEWAIGLLILLFFLSSCLKYLSLPLHGCRTKVCIL